MVESITAYREYEKTSQNEINYLRSREAKHLDLE